MGRSGKVKSQPRQRERGMMNRNETDDEKLERQLRAVADLQLDQEADEETLRAAIQEAAHRGTMDSWPDMPEDERKREVDTVAGMEALKFQLSIFKRGWSQGQGAERIQLDPEVAGPRILVRAYATAEADTVRMRNQAEGQSSEASQRPSLEDRIRRYLRPEE